MDLTGSVAVVTGSSRGLGRASALALAAAGADVIVNFRHSADRAKAVVRELQELGRNGDCIRADVSNADEVRSMRETVDQRYGPATILVNNAGVVARPGSWNEIDSASLQDTIGTDLIGTMNCIREFAPGMVRQGRGRIVNVSSTFALTGAAAVMAYTAAKAGVINITHSMARELGRHGVTVNCIAPGIFDTDMALDAGSQFVDWAVSTTPLGRLGRPEEIGDAVVFLVQAEFINGSVLVVDGGQVLNM